MTSARHAAAPGLGKVFALALPIIVSNVTVPLIGLVDTAVMGHLPDPAYIGAVALGALIFSFVYWGFGFLRMGTTGLTAQAFGRWQADGSEASRTELRAALARPLAGSLGVAAVILVLQWPVGEASFLILSGSDEVEALAATYFYVRVWGAPFTLGSYALLGWLLGQQATRQAVVMQIATNLLNVGLSLMFVLGFGWGVAGVAAASVIAEGAGLLLGLALARHRLTVLTGAPSLRVPRAVLLDRTALKRLAGVNFDIFVRTLCLVFAFAWLTDRSAQMGDVLLAANAVLLQFQTFTAYALDAFAFAAEALVGQAIGARDRKALRASIALTGVMGFAVAGLFSLAYLLLTGTLIGLMTDLPNVQAQALELEPWMIALPVISVGSFLLDGIFIGATRTAEMRNAMLVSVALFVATGYLFIGFWAVHGLWTAFTLFMVLRALTLLAYLPRVLRDADPQP